MPASVFFLYSVFIYSFFIQKDSHTGVAVQEIGSMPTVGCPSSVGWHCVLKNTPAGYYPDRGVSLTIDKSDRKQCYSNLMLSATHLERLAEFS